METITTLPSIRAQKDMPNVNEETNFNSFIRDISKGYNNENVPIHVLKLTTGFDVITVDEVDKQTHFFPLPANATPYTYATNGEFVILAGPTGQIYLSTEAIVAKLDGHGKFTTDDKLWLPIGFNTFKPVADMGVMNFYNRVLTESNKNESDL